MRRILLICYFLFFLTSPAFAEELGTLSSDNLEFALYQDGADFKLYIKYLSDLGDRTLTANIFPVKNPSRLVVDVPDTSKGSQKTLQIDNEFISTIRLGLHDNKARLVIDIKNDGVPTYDIVADEESVRLVASFSISPPKSPVAKKPTPQVTNEELATELTPKATAKPTPKIIKEPIEPIINDEHFEDSGTISIKPTPEKETETFVMRGNQEVVEDLKTAPSSGKQSLIKNILFQAPKDSPLGAIAIEGENLGEYQLEQKGKNLYELTLPNSKLSGDHLSLPQFPPAAFKGFEVILANQEGDNVLLKIYVNQEVKIKSFNAKGKLWLKAEK